MSKSSRLTPENLLGNPRATLRAWESYAYIIHQARVLFPQPYFFEPEGRSMSSIVSKIRDAVRGAIAFNYVDDVESLRDWFDKVEFRIFGAGLVIGPKETRKVEPLKEKKTGYKFTALSLDELNAFALLLATEKIVGPVEVESCIATYQSPYPNCFAQYQPNGTLLLL